MANANILAKKQEIIDEVKGKVNDATTIVLFDYRGLTDNESKELRIKLRESGSDYKIYKNTLMARAFDDLKIDVKSSLEGPSAFAYGTDAIAPIKVLTDFAKSHPALQLKVGIVDGEISDVDKLKQLAKLPSRETLLTQLAGALIAIPRDLVISLDLYAKQKDDGSVVEEKTEEKPVEETKEEPVQEETPVEEEKTESTDEVTEEEKTESTEESVQEEPATEEPEAE